MKRRFNIIKEESEPIIYHCVSANRTILGAKKIEFISDKIVEIVYKKDKNDDGYILEYKLLGNKFIGTQLIHEWASDMEKLQNHLIFSINKKGELISIKNRTAINTKWRVFFKDKMKEKYKVDREGVDLMIQETSKLLKDDNRFRKSFVGFNLYKIFFPFVYENYKTIKNEKYSINKYFGEFDLDFLLNSNLKENEKTKKIEVRGIVDKEKFAQEKFTKMIKKLTGALDIDATLNIKLEENYVFNKKLHLSEAELYLKTESANMYALATGHTIKEIDEREKERLLEEFNNVKEDNF